MKMGGGVESRHAESWQDTAETEASKARCI